MDFKIDVIRKRCVVDRRHTTDDRSIKCPSETSLLTPCHANYFPENEPVLTIQFYSKSVHVLIKEKTKISFLFFFFCAVDRKSHLHSRG